MKLDFGIPEKLKVYLSDLDLISKSDNSIENDSNGRIIHIRHLFPYSDEYINATCGRNKEIWEVTQNDSFNNVEEWSVLDFSDQPLKKLTYLNENKVVQLLEIFHSAQPRRRLFIEKVSLNELSPGFLSQFSICSTDVKNELNWLHIWRNWCRTSYGCYMAINSIWSKILKELDILLPVLLDRTWELLSQWYTHHSDYTSNPLNLQDYKNAFYHQNMNNFLAIISELLKKYFSKELWEWRITGGKPSE
ncbi:unnamed protein product [Trichobilharzia regenti]|nr:unnamed protein product [Trichobilharzia regenti]